MITMKPLQREIHFLRSPLAVRNDSSPIQAATFCGPPRIAAKRSASNQIRFKQIEFFDHSASSEKLACSVGDSPTGERVRDPVAWVVFVEETKRMKPTDKAILGMVSESPGRNVSEPRSGLDKK